MVDLSFLVGGLKAVEHSLNIVKALRDADFELEKSELKLQMAELMSALADAKIGLTSSKEQISLLEEEIERLMAFQKRKIRDVRGMYLEIDEGGQVIGGAFCSRCYDVDRKFIRIIESRKGERGMGFCPQCKTDYPLFEVEDRLPKHRDP